MPSVSSPKVVRGSAKDFIFEVEGDDEINADLDANPTVDITGPRGNAISPPARATVKKGLGRYLYQFQSSSTDALGFYTIAFTGTLGGRTVRDVRAFEVISK